MNEESWSCSKDGPKHGVSGERQVCVFVLRNGVYRGEVWPGQGPSRASRGGKADGFATSAYVLAAAVAWSDAKGGVHFGGSLRCSRIARFDKWCSTLCRIAPGAHVASVFAVFWEPWFSLRSGPVPVRRLVDLFTIGWSLKINYPHRRSALCAPNNVCILCFSRWSFTVGKDRWQCHRV